jgi:hypothetical protein
MHMQNEDLLQAALTPKDMRTAQQVTKLSAWFARLPGHAGLPNPALHALVHHLGERQSP